MQASRLPKRANLQKGCLLSMLGVRIRHALPTQAKYEQNADLKAQLLGQIGQEIINIDTDLWSGLQEVDGACGRGLFKQP